MKRHLLHVGPFLQSQHFFRDSDVIYGLGNSKERCHYQHTASGSFEQGLWPLEFEDLSAKQPMSEKTTLDTHRKASGMLLYLISLAPLVTVCIRVLMTENSGM